MGRVEGDEIRCMYHGMKFSSDGKCVHIPATDVRPPNSDVRTFPVVEQDGWIWVWPGNPEAADSTLIPKAWGLTTEGFIDKSDALEYDADYQLINDNLTDLSHLDFVHETTLGKMSGTKWSEDFPSITKIENGLRIQRWFPPAKIVPGVDVEFESWNAYDYLLPGVFLMTGKMYPVGTAEKFGHKEPTDEPVFQRFEQQAVTPMLKGKARYIFASGVAKGDGVEIDDSVNKFFEVVMAAFAEDKAIIEAQQKIWDITPENAPKAFIEQDKAPAIFRRMIKERLQKEAV